MKVRTNAFTVVRKGAASEKTELRAILLQKLTFGERVTEAAVKAGLRRWEPSGPMQALALGRSNRRSLER
jgi:hypothetical protein